MALWRYGPSVPPPRYGVMVLWAFWALCVMALWREAHGAHNAAGGKEGGGVADNDGWGGTNGGSRTAGTGRVLRQWIRL